MSSGEKGFEPLSTEETAKVETESPSNKNKLLFVLLGVGLLLVLVIVGVVLFFVLGGDDGKLDCSGDDFQGVTYNTSKTEQAYLKYKEVENSDGSLHNFSEAQKACQDLGLGAGLWEVLDGEPEWSAMKAAVLDKSPNPYWLNAKVKEQCPNGRAANCKFNEAQQGKGLAVTWASSNVESSYSRLIGGLDEECVYIDTQSPTLRLWGKQSCGNKYITLCVRRNCRKQ